MYYISEKMFDCICILRICICICICIYVYICILCIVYCVLCICIYVCVSVSVYLCTQYYNNNRCRTIIINIQMSDAILFMFRHPLSTSRNPVLQPCYFFQHFQHNYATFSLRSHATAMLNFQLYSRVTVFT